MKDDKGSLRLENQLCFRLYSASKEIVRRYKPYLDPLGITYTQYIAMMVLWAEDALTVKELGARLRLESSTLKVPHVGWDQAHLSEHGLQCPLFVDVPDGANLYFTHSYALADDVDADVVAARTHYARSFCSAVWRDNVFGVQFHPEKSSRVGLALLRNFVNVARG